MKRFDVYLSKLCEVLGHADARMLHGIDVAAQEKKRGTDCRTRRTASDERQTSVAAALRGQLDVVG